MEDVNDDEVIERGHRVAYNQKNLDYISKSSRSIKWILLKWLGILLIASCLAIPGFLSLVDEKQCAIENGNNQMSKAVKYDLPNGKMAHVIDDMIVITKEEASTIRMTKTVYSRVVDYLFQQLSRHEDRCTPWVVDKFYPNDIFALDHCMYNGTFTLKIINEETVDSVQEFSTRMTPFDVDLFLRQFDDVRKLSP